MVASSARRPRTEERPGLISQQSCCPRTEAPNPGPVSQIDEANLSVFGHRQLRPGQREIIVDTLRGRDVFVVMVSVGSSSSPQPRLGPVPLEY